MKTNEVKRLALTVLAVLVGGLLVLLNQRTLAKDLKVEVVKMWR